MVDGVIGAPRRNPAQEWLVVDGEAVLHHVERREMHHLNATATAVWLALDGRDVDAIARQLAIQFDAPVADVTRDVHAIVRELDALGVVEWEEVERRDG